MLSPYLRTTRHERLDSLPAEIADRTHWQCSSGSHSSDSREMLDSVMISARFNDGTEINIRYIVINGSSQWLIGRNVTSKCDIIHTNWSYLKLTNRNVTPPQNFDMHSYVSSYIFLTQPNNDSSNFQAKLFSAIAI